MLIFINGIAILVSGLFGMLLRNRVRPEMQAHFMPVFAAITTAIGIGLIAKGGNSAVATLALLGGMVIGELLKIEQRLLHMITAVSKRLPFLPAQDGETTGQLFISAFVLTVCSTAGILGAMTARLTGEFDLLLIKALLDFAICLFYTISAGPIIMLLSVPVMAVLFAVYGVTALFAPVITEQMTLDFCMCGGMIQIVNAIKMMRGKDVAAANLVPALLLSLLISGLASCLT